MDQPEIAFTAVFLKGRHGYTGFVEELPGVNSQGQTLEEARSNLQRLASVVFDEERAQSEALLAGKEVVREEFRIAIPVPRNPAAR
jgi:predicted RNase H-like HicB family nuclease